MESSIAKGTCEVDKVLGSMLRVDMDYGAKWKGNARKVDACRVFANGTVLDIGCAARQAEQYCRGVYIGFDCRTVDRGRKPDVLGDAHLLPFKCKSFNTVLAFDVIEHLARGDLFVSECTRALEPNGKMLVTTSNGPRSPFARADPTHISIYTAKTLRILLEKKGLRTVSCNVFNIHSRLLLPIRLLPGVLGEYLASRLVSEIFMIGIKQGPAKTYVVAR